MLAALEGIWLVVYSRGCIEITGHLTAQCSTRKACVEHVASSLKVNAHCHASAASATVQQGS